VLSQTLIHQVQFPENQDITQDEYAFCSNQQCDVVYFSSSNVIRKQKVRTFKDDQKEMLCYCFDISKSQYQLALASGTSGNIKGFVVQQTKSSSCACEIRNPSGRCCLANFKRMEKDYDNR